MLSLYGHEFTFSFFMKFHEWTNVAFLQRKAYTCVHFIGVQAQYVKYRFPYPEIIPTLGLDLEQRCFLLLSLPLSIVIKVRKIFSFLSESWSCSRFYNFIILLLFRDLVKLHNLIPRILKFLDFSKIFKILTA